jgi:hypothetical protein
MVELCPEANSATPYTIELDLPSTFWWFVAQKWDQDVNNLVINHENTVRMTTSCKNVVSTFRRNEELSRLRSLHLSASSAERFSPKQTVPETEMMAMLMSSATNSAKPLS